MKPEAIVEFLEGFRRLHGASGVPARSRLISIKIPEDFLAVFRAKAELEGVAYQMQIKTAPAGSHAPPAPGRSA